MGCIEEDSDEPVGIGFAFRALPPELPFGLCLPLPQILLPTRSSRCCKGPEVIFPVMGLFFTGLLSVSGVHRSGLPTWRCRGLLEQDPSSNWSQLCLQPVFSHVGPMIGQPLRTHPSGACGMDFARSISDPMPHSKVEGKVSVVVGGSARIWIPTAERPSVAVSWLQNALGSRSVDRPSHLGMPTAGRGGEAGRG